MFKSVLVPVDVAHQSSWEVAIPEAMDIALANRATIALVTVVPELRLIMDGLAVPYEMEQMMAKAKVQLANIAHRFRHTDVAIEHEVRFGLIGHEIVTAAAERDADLILMASHRPEMRDYIIGPHAAHVARHASCSVLILRKVRR